MDGSEETLLAEDGGAAVRTGDDDVTAESAERYTYGARPDEHGERGPTEIGRGGIGRVLVAWDRHLGREIAVKELLRGGGAGTGTVSTGRTVVQERFVREARVTGRLEHPGIVPVHEIGRRDDGTLYYTMKLVRGRTLRDALQEAGTLDGRLRLLGHVLGLSQAIAYAHSKGVVHRDLKPDNVMLGAFGETVVLDWGLAKVIGGAGDDPRSEPPLDLAGDPVGADVETMKTMAGTVVGTPAYMSPEQASGRVADIDERSDVWGLGAVLYHLLTGRPPFLGATGTETLRLVREAPLEPVRARAPEAPPELAAVCEKALRKDPSERYATAKALAEEIEAFLHGRQVRAYEYGSWELLRRFASRNRALTAAVATATVGGIAGSLVLYDAWRSEGAARDREAEARREAEQHAVVASRAREEALESARAAKESERTAHAHLSAAYREKSRASLDDEDPRSALVYAAAAIAHSPASPRGAWREEPASPERATALGLERALLHASHAEAMRRLDWTFERALGPASGLVREVAVSPDSRRVLLGTTEGELRLHDLATGALEATFRGPTSAHRRAAFFPDGERLAILDPGGAFARVVRRDTGEVLGRTPDLDAPAIQVAVTPGGTRLAVATDHLLRLHDAGTLAPLADLPASFPASLVFSPDGRVLAAGGLRGPSYFYDTAAATVLRELTPHAGGTTSVAFSPSGVLVATGGADGRVRLRALRTGQELDSWDLAGGDVAFHPEGPIASTAGSAVEVRDIASREVVSRIRGHATPPRHLAFTPDGERLVTAGESEPVALVWRRVAAEVGTRFAASAPVSAVALSRDASLLAAATTDGHVEVFDAASGLRRARLPSSIHTPVRVVVDASAGRVAAVDHASQYQLWDVVSGATLAEGLRGPEDVPAAAGSGLAIAPAANLLAVTGPDGGVRFVDLRDGRDLTASEGTAGIAAASDLASSPDGSRLAAGAGDGRVFVVRAADRALETSLRTGDRVLSLAFSPDGDRLAVAGAGGRIHLRSLALPDAEPVAVHADEPADHVLLAFTADGTGLVAGDRRGFVRLFDAGTGELLLRIGREGRPAAFAPVLSGRAVYLAEGARIRLVRFETPDWTRDPADLLRRAESAAGLHLDGLELLPAHPAPVDVRAPER